MNLSAPFIHRPVMTTLAMVALLFAGILAYINLPISSMPNVTYPTINVKVSYPGGLPETMANSIALPLEKQFMAIPGMRLVSSNNTLGAASINLQFQIDKDMTTAAQDVQEAITIAIPNLPPNLPYGPIYRKVNPAEQPIIYLSLTSDTIPRTELYTYANTLIGQRLSMLEGVSQVTTFGSIRAVRIQVDPTKMVTHDVTLTEVAKAVSLGNAYIATGQLDGGIEAPIIQVNGDLQHIKDYENLIISYKNGTPVRIMDIGRAVDDFQNNKIHPYYINDTAKYPTVVLAIQKEPNANTVAIADAMYAILDNLKDELPPAIALHIVHDRSVPIRAAISDANQTLLIALVLVVLVIFLFFGKIADTIIPSLVLPMSVIGTFFVMSLLNFTLDNLSVLALTLAAGFIIDDAVVVMENIVRRIEEGETPLEASLKGSQQISFTIVSMTLSLVAVFIPMLFMGGLIGKIFNEFAITLTVVTVLSGIISLTLTPMLCSRFLPPRDKTTAHNTFMSNLSDNLNHRFQNIYLNALTRVLDHQKTALVLGFFCLIATVVLFIKLPTDFVPDEDVGFLTIFTQEREGGSSYSMLDNENELIKIVKSNPAVERMVAISSYSEYRKGLNIVPLKPLNQRLPIQTVIQQLNKSLEKINGIQAFIKNIPLIDLAVGQESRLSYQYALESISKDKLYSSARKILAKMKIDPVFQGVTSDLEIDSPQINVSILRDQASRLGITATDVENTFSYSYSGNFVTRIQTAVDQYQVILELYPELQRLASTLNTVWLRNSLNNLLVPLSAAMKWEEGLGASSINHINQFPAVTVSFNLAPGVPLETGLNKINEIMGTDGEAGVSGHSIGAAQTFQESINSAGYLLLLTLFCIYIILGCLYESYIHPITILSTLPPATLGGLLVLLIFGLPLSLYSFLGIIMLIGIVKKNGIMMVDFALENIRHRGMNSRDAIINACMVRFRPIMMTTVAAIFGVLPIALGFGANAAARRPLGMVIIGGLLLSQLITLFITPILYLTMENLHERISRK